MKEAFGSGFSESRASYTAPPCNSQQFNPNDPYGNVFSGNNQQPDNSPILEKIQLLERQIETFVSGGGGPNVTANALSSRRRLENILHYVLLSIFVALVMENIV